MNREKLKLIFRCSMFAVCALMAFPTIMAVIGGTHMLVSGGFAGAGVGVTMLIYGLSPWIGVVAFWSAAEILFDMSDKFAKMDSGGRDKSVSHGSSQANWESWKKVGK